jgi:hypothetical protein
MIRPPKLGTINLVRPELFRVVYPDWLIGIRLVLSGGIVGGSSDLPWPTANPPLAGNQIDAACNSSTKMPGALRDFGLLISCTLLATHGKLLGTEIVQRDSVPNKFSVCHVDYFSYI